MLNRFSILSATFVTVLGILLGLVSPASASFLPHDRPPVSNVHMTSVRKLPEVYVVKRGDSLSSIAVKFHKRWEKLYCANRKIVGNKPWLIQPKMRLTIKESRNLCRIPVEKIVVHKTYTPKVVSAPSKPVQTLSTTGVQLGSGSFQSCVISRESGGNPTAINPSSGASGLYGMLLSTWDSLPASRGYPGGAYTAPVSVQNEAFNELYARDGTSPWAAYDGC